MLRSTATLYKKSFAGLSPQTWLLSLTMLINRSGTMVVPFMTLYLTSKQINRSLSEAGLVLGLFGLGSMVGAFFGGRITDRKGFFGVQLFALLVGGLLFIILGQVKSYPLICVFTFLLSVVNESFRPANQSAVAYYSSAENRTRSYSLNRLAINLGWAIGASIGGIIATYNYELLFWVDGFTNIFAGVLLFMFLRPGKLKLQKKEEPPATGTASVYADKVYLFFIGLSVLFAICFFQLFTTVPKYFRDNLHLTEDYIGLIMAINGLIIVLLEMVLVYVLEQRNKIVLFIGVGTAICGLAFFTLMLPGEGRVLSLLMILLITFGEIASMPFMNTFWSRRSAHHNRGQYAALYTIAWGAGQTFGPLVCSLVADNFGFNVLFASLGLTLLFAAYGFSRLPEPAAHFSATDKG